MSIRTAAILLICFWLVAFYLTHTPISGNGWMRQLLVHSPIKSDKLAHGVLYFGLSGLMANFLGRWTRSKRILAPLTFILVMTYGVLDEFLQSFVPTRSADLYDLLADGVGTFIGTTVFIGLRSGKARLKTKRGSTDSSSDNSVEHGK